MQPLNWAPPRNGARVAELVKAKALWRGWQLGKCMQPTWHDKLRCSQLSSLCAAKGCPAGGPGCGAMRRLKLTILIKLRLTRSLPRGTFTDSHPDGQHFWQCCFRFWRKGCVFLCQTNSKCNTTWSKSNVIQTYDGAKVTVFVRFESESARRRHMHCSCSRSDVALVEILQAQRPSTEHKRQRWWRWGLFFTFEGLSSVWLLFYQRFDAALLLWSSPDRWLAMFHSRRCSYIRTDDPSRQTGVHCELEHRGLRSLRAVWSIFSHQAPPSPVSSASQSPPPFPSPSLSTRWNQLSPRSPSSRKHSNVQLVPACVASGNIHNAVSRHLDANRAMHRKTVFSMNKAQESKQRSTNWRRRQLENM